MEEFRQTCAAKMQKASHKAQREQQLLQLQMFQQQQEKQQQQEDMTQILQERQRLEDRCASFEREHTQLGPRLEETRWEVRSVCIAQYSENTPNGNASISQKLTYIEKIALVVRSDFKKLIIRKSAMQTFFLAFTSHVASHNHCSMHYNLQETLHTWSRSNIRGINAWIIYTAPLTADARRCLGLFQTRHACYEASPRCFCKHTRLSLKDDFLNI